MTLHWSYKDLFRSFRLGFSAKKIWMQFWGVVIAWAGYLLLTYLAFAVSRESLGKVWQICGLIPVYAPLPSLLRAGVFIGGLLPWWGTGLWIVGTLWIVLVLLMTNTAIGYVTFEQLRGNDFVDVRVAFGYALRRLKAVVMAPLMPLLFILFVIVLGLILGLLGAIPGVGTPIVGLFALPAFGACLFVLYLLIVFFAAVLLAPAVAGTTRYDAFDMLFEVFSCVNEQVWRLVSYLLVVVACSLSGMVILGWFSWMAMRLGGGVLQVSMGAKLAPVLEGWEYFLPPSAFPRWVGDFIPDRGISAGLGADQTIGAVLIGLCAVIIVAFVIGYAGSVWGSGMTLLFVVLSKKKDGKNLLEEVEDEGLVEDEVVTSSTAECPHPNTQGAAPKIGTDKEEDSR